MSTRSPREEHPERCWQVRLVAQTATGIRLATSIPRTDLMDGSPSWTDGVTGHCAAIRASAHADPGRLGHASGDGRKLRGCNDYYPKPIEVDEFVRFMRPYLVAR
jgi:hypothetical protein